MGSQQPLRISCDTHGDSRCAVVCGHMVHTKEKVVGFIENSSDPDDLQAWCFDCERVFKEENGMSEEFRKFNDMSVVCEHCYRELRKRHSTGA